MNWRFGAAIVLPFLAFAQSPGYTGLATNRDGSVLYFSTSLRATGSDQPNYGKVFIADGTSVKLYASEEYSSAQIYTNYYNLSQPGVSADGNVTWYTAGRDCFSSTCIFSDGQLVQVLGVPNHEKLSFAGLLLVSRNGKYAVNSHSLRYNQGFGGNLVDLESGASLDLGALIVTLGVTSSGQAFIYNAQSPSPLAVAGFSGVRTIPVSSIAITPSFRRGSAAISDDGSQIIYTTPDQKCRRFHLDNNFDEPFVDSVCPVSTHTPPDLNYSLSGSLPNGAVISDDGQVAFYADGNQSITRLEIQTGSKSTWVLGPLLADSTSVAAVPGSAYRLYGERTVAPKLTMNGTPVPVLSLSPNLLIQIPWNVPPGMNKIEVAEDESPLTGSPTFRVEAVSPRFFMTADSDPIILAAHDQPFTLVTQDNPVRSGEIVRLYMTGLGSIDRPIPDGQPGPAQPLLPVAIFALDGDHYTPVEVISAIYSGDLVGFYEVRIRIPADVYTSSLFLRTAGEVGKLPISGR